MEAWKGSTVTVITVSANMVMGRTARDTKGARATDKEDDLSSLLLSF